jgi:type IV fimbrial biogenesis protein FimT
MLMLAYRQRGVSLIELMIGMAVFGILLAVAAPSYQVWIANGQVRTAAESIQNGLQVARTEALKRNQAVEFILTSTEPSDDNANAIAATASGPNWMVRVFQPTGNYTTDDFIQGRSGSDGSAHARLSVSPQGQNTIQFSPLGRASFFIGTAPQTAANGIFIAAKHASGTCGAGSDQIRCLAVGVKPGGQIRMCDLTVSNKTDSRYCS